MPRGNNQQPLSAASTSTLHAHNSLQPGSTPEREQRNCAHSNVTKEIRVWRNQRGTIPGGNTVFKHSGYEAQVTPSTWDDPKPGDIYEYTNLNNNQKRYWVYNDAWVRADSGQKHPTKGDRVLRVTENKEPDWVTDSTMRSWSSRTKTEGYRRRAGNAGN